MATIARMSRKRALRATRLVTIELPEFIVQTLEHRVEEANAIPGEPDEHVTLDHLVELHLAETVSIAELALLELSVPGITAAASKWLIEIH